MKMNKFLWHRFMRQLVLPVHRDEEGEKFDRSAEGFERSRSAENKLSLIGAREILEFY